MTNGITKDESAAIGKFIEETSKLNMADVIKSVCKHEWYETENYYIKCKKCNKLRENERFISRKLKKNKMSLDVYLITKEPQIKKASSGIFVRENGQTKEITQEEWNAKNPNSEPVKFEQEETETNEVYSANITHNLNTMAGEAGIYEHLWRPDEIKITKAKELIEPLRQGLHNLKSEPERYKKFKPENGWGSYDGLVTFVENYLNACYEYPDADVEVSR